MKVFVAGATGALGQQLVPQLVARGHEVVGMTRSAGQAGPACAASARGRSWPTRSTPTRSPRPSPQAEPEVIVHQLTALSGDALDLRALRPRRSRMTNRLRTEGTDHLLAAGRAVGARRFVAQSYARLAVRPHRRARSRPRTTRSTPHPPAAAADGRSAAIRHLERAVTGDRLGRGRRAALRRLLRAGHRRQPRPAAASMAEPSASASSRSSATAAGVVVVRPHRGRRRRDRRAPSSAARPAIYNVVDDEPAPVREWLPALAAALGRQAAAARAALARAGSSAGEAGDGR